MSQANPVQIIARAADRLKAAGIDAGAAEAEIILCELLDCDRLFLYLHGPSLIDDELLGKFDEIVERRLTRYPLQYILGSAWFYGRKFSVNEAVMVPTPETELLLNSLLGAVSRCNSNPVRVLDIGTGSGVVALSAKLENPDLDVVAIDLSEDALEVAAANAKKLGLGESVLFVCSDLFSELDRSEKFDIIASNPPYIADGDYATLPPEVLADPKSALLAGPKGLDIIERLIAETPDYLTQPGFLMFEIGYSQAKDVFDTVQSDDRYADCSLLKDLNDIDRVVICKVE